MAAWNEDEFWKEHWSDICGVCGERMDSNYIIFEIKIKKACKYEEEVFFLTQVCEDSCVDKAFELLAVDSPGFKRFYKFKAEAAGSPDYEQYTCTGCGSIRDASDRHIVVYARGPYGETYIILEHCYCSYKCYKDSINLGKSYVGTMMKKYGSLI